MAMMYNDDVAKCFLRPVVSGASRGTPAGKQYEAIVRAAAGYDNIQLGVPADYYHKIFTRPKSNGLEVRMIVDGTCAGDVNAANQRLPRPIPPPAMFAVRTVVRVYMTCKYIAVDDIRTAFANFEMCSVMQRAHGVAVFTRSGGVLRGVSTRVIQGGTWSATVCQYQTLTVALDPANAPERESGDYTVPATLIAERTKGVSYVNACLRARRLVHVDDVMSGGDDAATLDRDRLWFRERAEREYNVRWKPFEASAKSGRLVGVHIDCEGKWWSVCPVWAEKLERALETYKGGAVWTSQERQWFDGVSVWVLQVTHQQLPLPTWLADDGDMPGAMAALVAMARERVAATEWVAKRRLGHVMTAWPRPGKHGGGAYSISDASKRGWAGARTDGVTRCGYWHWCATNKVHSTQRCCADGRVLMESGDVYKGEALASLETAYDVASEGRDLLIVTDSKIWVDTLLAVCAGDRVLAACAVAMAATATGERAVAHCAGHGDGANYADQPSHDVTGFTVVGVPPPSSTAIPRWSVAGVARHGDEVRDMVLTEACRYLPCLWARRLGL